MGTTMVVAAALGLVAFTLVWRGVPADEAPSVGDAGARTTAGGPADN